MAVTNRGSRVDCLDGLRGIAALWVLVGHAHILSGFKVPLIGDPDLGVDLFILLSGFLMVFHYRLREEREPWGAPSTWKTFWARRFFRIAPLYYVMLVAAIMLGPLIYESRMVIDAFNGVPPQPAVRFVDQGIWNWIAHLSFLFGAVPNYAYRTALPDWSIGLEMQFYLALPFLMLLIQRLGLAIGLFVIVAAGTFLAFAAPHAGLHFPMPSFLPLKMHVFAAGMLMASIMQANRERAWIAFACAVVMILLPVGGGFGGLRHIVARIAIISAFFVLVHHDKLPALLGAPASRAARVLGNRFFHQLGELSFGVYLVHLLVMQPTVAFLISHTSLASPARWLATLAITIPVAYLIAAVGYRFVEVPGQALGKSLTRKRVAVA